MLGISTEQASTTQGLSAALGASPSFGATLAAGAPAATNAAVGYGTFPNPQTNAEVFAQSQPPSEAAGILGNFSPAQQVAASGPDMMIPANAQQTSGILGGSQTDLAASNVYQGGPGCLAFIGAGGISTESLKPVALTAERS